MGGWDGGKGVEEEEREDARCEQALRVHAHADADTDADTNAATKGSYCESSNERTWRYPLRLVFTAVSTSPSRL